MAVIGHTFHIVVTGEHSSRSARHYGVRATKAYVRALRDELRAAGHEVIGGASAGYRIDGIGRLYVERCARFGCAHCGQVTRPSIERHGRHGTPSAHPRWHDREWLREVGAR